MSVFMMAYDGLDQNCLLKNNQSGFRIDAYISLQLQ